MRPKKYCTPQPTASHSHSHSSYPQPYVALGTPCALATLEEYDLCLRANLLQPLHSCGEQILVAQRDRARHHQYVMGNGSGMSTHTPLEPAQCHDVLKEVHRRAGGPQVGGQLGGGQHTLLLPAVAQHLQSTAGQWVGGGGHREGKVEETKG